MTDVAGLVILVVGCAVALVSLLLARREAVHQRERSAAEVAEARERSTALLDEAKLERGRAESDLLARRGRMDDREARLAEQDARLLEQRTRLDEQVSGLAGERQALEASMAVNRAQMAERAQAWDGEEATRRAALEQIEQQARDDSAAHEWQRQTELERVAGFTADQARAELVGQLTQAARREALVTVRQIEDDARRDGEDVARRIVTDAVQRVAADQIAESVVTVVHLPADDFKGRIIGREGRNIRTFEAVTGVNLVIDDTPGAVLLSCFDPVRRETARVTLEALIADGRIHPQRIEAEYADAGVVVERLIERAGAEAVARVGVHDLHPDLVRLMGTLRYRTSYGQNVLGHLIETANVSSSMAADLGVDIAIVKRCAFLHDIGKALTHEVEGTHAMIGADLARRYGEHEDVVHAIRAHHNEVAPQTVEAVLTQAADACSGGRPGARREALESYVERLNKLEAIALGHAGVDRVFAMSAGREVRVMVQPHEVDDAGAELLARDIAAQIHDELTYPGQIKITVVRESRAIATAT